jgi:xylitol oxidase
LLPIVITTTMNTSSSENTASQSQKLKNWAGNLTYSTANIYYPQTVEEVQQLVKNNSRLKALGTRHCFNTIADDQHNLVAMTKMDKVLNLDTHAHTVTIEAGIKYGDLAPYLHDRGFALHNLASLPHISVAGSCATATHGSGVKNGNLATAITSLEMVIADGSVVRLSKTTDAEKLNAAAVGLGALGIITKLTLQIEPAYDMQQSVYTDLPMAELEQHFEAIVSAGYSVSLFTTWQNKNINTVWIKERGDKNNHQVLGSVFYGAKAALADLHPIPGISAEHCTGQMHVSGPWFDRLPHFKMGFTPSSGEELQSEYFVPIHHAVEAIMAIARLGEQITPHLLISEIRTIAADNLWMSPCYKQDSVAIHFTWKPNWPEVQKLLPLIEQELSPFKARPHWGKLFTMSPQVIQSRYEKLPDFKKRIAEYDPQGKFRNEFLENNLYNV